MARIPDEGAGALQREGESHAPDGGAGNRAHLTSQGKDLVRQCPWHEGDDTPSCIVTPATNPGTASGVMRVVR